MLGVLKIVAYTRRTPGLLAAACSALPSGLVGDESVATMIELAKRIKKVALISIFLKKMAPPSSGLGLDWPEVGLMAGPVGLILARR